jgi:hypothetical protein
VRIYASRQRITQRKCQSACKPGSVPAERLAPPRWPFIWDARRRAPQATNPDGDAETHSAPQPKPQGCAVPIRFCSRRGLPCQLCRQRCGALLPHPFTLARANASGLLSVALSLGSPLPDIIRRRVSVEPGLSSTREALRPRGPQRAFRAAAIRPTGALSKGLCAGPVKRAAEKYAGALRQADLLRGLRCYKPGANHKQRQLGVLWHTEEL